MKALLSLAPLCLVTTATVDAETKHQFLCIGNSKNVLVYVDQFNSTNSWSIKIPSGSRDIQQVGENKILVSHGNGAAEYALDTGKKLSWSVNRYRRVQSARRLPSGHTALLTGNGTIITLDKDGKELNKITINQKNLDLRLFRKTNNGNWIIGAKNPRAVLEVSPQGKVLKTSKLPGKGYTALKLDNGNYLSSTGDECKVVEVTTDGKVTRFVGGKAEHPQLKLDFNSGWSQLPNGNIIMTNWLGHNKHNTAPHLIEFNQDNKVIWKWEDHKTVKQVTNVLVLK